MCISHQGNHKVRLSIDGQQVEQVDQFKYLGSVISATEIRCRTALGKQAFMNKKETVHGQFAYRVEKENSKQCVVECGVVHIRTQADRKRLEAMEMWIWRRMEKISWVDKISNEEVLQRINETKTMLDTIRKCKHVWLGHVLRYKSLLHDITEGRMKGKATQGRKRMHLPAKCPEKKESMCHSKGQLKTGKSGKNC